MTITLDMDGTIADLYGVDCWLDKLRSEDVTPYEDAAPLVDMNALKNAINYARARGIKTEIVSWNCGGNPSKKYQKRVADAKRKWLASYGLDFDSVMIVDYGTPKHEVVEDDTSVLFDDNESVRMAWEESGKGVAYDVNDIVRIVYAIVEVVCRINS